MTEVARLGAFLTLGRPHFLIGGLLLFARGSALARVEGVTIDWQRYVWGQVTITAAQWMTHYSNDYFDLEADRANATPTRWSGGSRVLVRNLVAPRAALFAAVGLGLTALFAAGVLATRADGPRLAFPLCLLIIVLSWCYSSPPLRLLSRGLGEATTAFVVTLLTRLLGSSAHPRLRFIADPFLARITAENCPSRGLGSAARTVASRSALARRLSRTQKLGSPSAVQRGAPRNHHGHRAARRSADARALRHDAAIFIATAQSEQRTSCARFGAAARTIARGGALGRATKRVALPKVRPHPG